MVNEQLEFFPQPPKPEKPAFDGGAVGRYISDVTNTGAHRDAMALVRDRASYYDDLDKRFKASQAEVEAGNVAVEATKPEIPEGVRKFIDEGKERAAAKRAEDPLEQVLAYSRDRYRQPESEV